MPVLLVLLLAVGKDFSWHLSKQKESKVCRLKPPIDFINCQKGQMGGKWSESENYHITCKSASAGRSSKFIGPSNFGFPVQSSQK